MPASTLAPIASSAPRAALSQLRWTGQGLQRPECVLATRSGHLYVADWRSGVTIIAPNGQQRLIAAQPVDGETLKPNGIALRLNGSFLLAHLGAERGGVFSLARDGQTRPVLTQVQGQDLPPTNFPLLDRQGRLWVTVSTRRQPRDLGYRADCDDGFIVLMDERGARIVADGLGYTNEIAFDPSGQWLYVNETFARKLSRFRVSPGGELGPKEVVTQFGAGTYPDGLAMDVDGGVWVVSIVSNRVIRVAPNGKHQLHLQDQDDAHIAWTEEAYQQGRMGRAHLDGVKSHSLRNISSLAFGGPELKTAYLGCLLGDRIASFNSRHAGCPPVHWEYT